MSFVTLTPGSKAQNVVYVAFGLTLGLFLFRLLSPSIFSDIVATVRAALLAASILGALLYYARLERIWIWMYKRWIAHRNMSSLEQIIVMKRLKFQTWRIAITEKWETPREEAKFAVDAVMKGPDLHDDIWSINGGVYFMFGVFFLLFSLGLPLNQVVAFAIWSADFVFVALCITYWRFPSRCWKIAVVRSIQETQSLIKSRPLDVTRTRTIGNEPTSVMSLSEPVMIELGAMISSRDWMRFERRFDFVQEEYQATTKQLGSDLLQYYLDSLVQIHTNVREKYKENLHVQSKTIERLLRDVVLKGVLTEDPRLEKALSHGDSLANNPTDLLRLISSFGMESYYEIEAKSLLQNFITNRSEELNSDLVSEMIEWIRQKRFSLAESVIEAAGILDDDSLSTDIIRVLFNHPDNQVWARLTPTMAQLLVGMKDTEVSESITKILRTRKRELLVEIIPHIDLRDKTLAKELALVFNDRDDTLKEAVVKRFKSQIMFNRKSQDIYEVVLPSLLNDEDLNVRILTIDILSSVLSSSSKFQRRSKAYNICIKLIENTIKNDVSAARRAGLSALGKVGNRTSIPVLQAVLDEKSGDHTDTLASDAIDQIKRRMKSNS